MTIANHLNEISAASPSVPFQEKPQRYRPALRSYLVLLVMAVMLPLLALGTYAVWRAADADRQRIERNVRERARALRAAIDRDLDNQIAVLRTLATAGSLRSGNLAGFQQRAEQVAGLIDGWIVLTDPGGQQLVNTLQPFGTALPAIHIFPNMAANPQPTVSDLFAGIIAKRPVIAIGVPVIVNGAVSYILGARVLPEHFDHIVADQDLPPDWPTTIVDRQGVILARSHDSERWVGHPASLGFRSLVSQQVDEGVIRNVTLEGIPVYTALSRSTLSGWSVGISVPLEAIDGPPMSSAILTTSIGALLLLLGTGAALMLGLRITRPMQALVADAAALGKGQMPTMRPSGLSEIDQVGRALIEACEARHKLERQLVHAQRMEAVGNLTGGLAHDFNNLLGVIVGNLDMLCEHKQHDPDVTELGGEALQAALRGADLTRRLLAFARRQPLQPRRIDANEFVAETVKLLGRMLGENIEIALDLDAETWPIVVDPAQLEASVLNLATNARDAMPTGGRLRIATGNRTLDEDYTRQHPDAVAGDYVMIEVSDNGTGMTPDIAARIFEPFYTTKETGKGTGLGLSMVFGFLKQSGGHINVYSEPGVGTTFRLYLPRAVSDGEAAQTRRPAAPLARGAGETVLAVEDNVAMRRVVVRQIEELGYRVLEAENSAAALQILDQTKVDVMFTDVVMPGEKDGIGLAHAALERWPALKVILTSGFPGTKIDGHFGPDARVRLLSKPYRKEELSRMLRDAIHG